MLGRDPEQLQIIIEIPAHSPAIEYEIDKQSGALFVKRFLPTSMHFPCDYGYIPNTSTPHHAFLTAIAITPYPVSSHCLMLCRAIGMLEINNDGNIENKIVVVPSDELSDRYDEIHTLDQLSPQLLAKIEHFFKHYQDNPLCKNNLSTCWHDKNAAQKEVLNCIQRYEGKVKELLRA